VIPVIGPADIEARAELANALRAARLRLSRAAEQIITDMNPYGLADLTALVEDIRAIEGTAANAVKARGFTWREIAEPQGITAQTAQIKYGRDGATTVRGRSRRAAS
jgi:hypothetical protein